MVPKNIFMTFKNKKVPKEIFIRWKTLNPDYKIHFYTDKDCIDFLRKNYNNNYANFFKKIRRGPHKADFWRLCVLYKYGGIYADIDLVPIRPISEIIGDSNFCTCLSIKRDSIFQAFISTIPRNIFIKKCIMSLYNKRNDSYFWSDYLSPTKDMYNVMASILNKNRLYSNKYYYHKEYDSEDIYIGYSHTNSKEITLQTPLSNDTKLIIKNNKPHIKYDYKINNNKLIIKRIDKNFGWSNRIYGQIITNDLTFYKIKILDEFLLRPRIINAFVRFNNKVLLKSRDVSYYRSKKKGLL